MFIQSLELTNIRSYEHEKITFSEGRTLLSGDIGCGKTTILIALEYALFGLLRGKTTPGELLRHGARSGSVTLVCEINGKQVSITRGLKRGSSSISQTTGSLTVDGVTEEYVATELKAKVLDLLGYPESLLSRSINLFRYTVYTPQEQVKQILFETVEERKDIIRKIFNIDKYKTVGTNIVYYTGDVRERIARLKGQTDDTKTLTVQLESHTKELSDIEVQLPALQKSLEKAVLDTKEAKGVLEKKRKEQELLVKQQHEQQLVAQQLKQFKNRLVELQDQEKRLSGDVKELKEVSFDKEKLTKVAENLTKISEKKSLLNRKFGELQTKKEQANKLTEKVSSMEHCPVCEQDVGSDHKVHIAAEQEKLLSGISAKEIELRTLEEKILSKEKELVELQKKLSVDEKNYLLFVQQKKQQEYQQKQIVVVKDQQKELVEKIGVFEKKVLADVAKPLSLEKENELVEQSGRIERQLELQLRELQTKAQVAKNIITQLKDSLSKREQVAKDIELLTSTYNWVQEFFVPLVKTIEKRVLLQVYQEFNTYFMQWFSQLIDDDSLTVRLDEDFTPLIEQNGFDTSVANLSGGEKTSVALSYRLALNKVLNNYFGSLHTKGLLVLDEPTDGFSSEQLDKLRDVLDGIGVKQLLIVSHEQKLASLADHIIRVEKSGQISKVSS